MTTVFEILHMLVECDNKCTDAKIVKYASLAILSGAIDIRINYKMHTLQLIHRGFQESWSCPSM